MSFNEGQEVQLNTHGTPVDGKEAIVKGTITKLTHGHAIVCLKSVSEGVRLAVKPSGELVLLGEKGTLAPDWKQLKTGDIEAVPLADIVPVREYKPMPEWITREQAEHWLGEFSGHLDSFIESGIVKQSVEGLLRTSDVTWLRGALPTYAENARRESERTSHEQAKAQEARRYVERIGQLASS